MNSSLLGFIAPRRRVRGRPRLALWPLVVGLIFPLPVGTAVAGWSHPGWATAGQPAPLLTSHGDGVPDHYVVVLKPGGSGSTVAYRHGLHPDYVYSASITGFAAELTSRQLAAVRHDQSVSYIAQDQRISIDTVPRESEDPPVRSQSFEQSPPWGLDRIDQRDSALDGRYRYTATGRGVTVYVIDTGTYLQHADFEGRALAGFTAVEDGNGTNDCNGHGTHVSGIIGGKKYGVAKNVRLISVRVLNCQGDGTFAGVIAGVDWVTYHHEGPSVANMSLNGLYHQPLNDAVANSISQGVTYTLSAGNHYGNACNESPSATLPALTVGATDPTDQRATWSNSGPCVDLFAPGVDIPSAWIGEPNATSTMSGTSMAAPYVAGLAALYLQANPDATPVTVNEVLTTAAIDAVKNPGDAPNLLARKWNGTLWRANTSRYQPDGMSWRQENPGYIQLWLLGTKGTDPDLYLQRLDGSEWQNVAKSTGPTSREEITFSGTAGIYRIRVYAYSGTGTYDVWALRQA